MISTRIAQKKLMILWCLGGLLVFLILIIRTVGNEYGSKVDDAWSWFLPTVIPTLSLMITVAIVDFTQTSSEDKQSDRFLYRLAFWLSFVYLLLVFFTILDPMPSGNDPIEFMKESNLWLGPLQGLVAAILGAFFVKSKNA